MKSLSGDIFAVVTLPVCPTMVAIFAPVAALKMSTAALLPLSAATIHSPSALQLTAASSLPRRPTISRFCSSARWSYSTSTLPATYAS